MTEVTALSHPLSNRGSGLIEPTVFGFVKQGWICEKFKAMFPAGVFSEETH